MTLKAYLKQMLIDGDGYNNFNGKDLSDALRELGWTNEDVLNFINDMLERTMEKYGEFSS